MAKEEPQAKADRFLPMGEASAEGAREKMRYLAEHTHIRIGVPLRQQIFELLASANAQQVMGLTVQEVAHTLSLNTKTCAKVLDEMTARCEGVRATAHRYGRVYQYKYLVQLAQEADESSCVEDDEYTKSLNPQLHAELKSTDTEIQQLCRKAMSISLKDRPQGSRTRITHQNFIRALFIVHKLRTQRIASIFEMKVSIKEELEPNIRWSLDKKTVLRIVWKLQRVGLIRQMCFRVVLRKHTARVVDYLGDDFESIREDKRRYSPGTCMVLYRVLISLPDVYERDPEVLDNPLLSGKKPDSPKEPQNATIRSRLLKSAIAAGNERTKAIKRRGQEVPSEPYSLLRIAVKKEEEKGDQEEPTNGLSDAQNSAIQKSQQLFVMATFVFNLYRKKLTNRYEALFARLRARPEVIALKRLLGREVTMPGNDPIGQYITENPLKKRCLWSLELPLAQAPVDDIQVAISPPPPVSVKGGKKPHYKEIYSTGKKLLLWLARHPGAKSLSAFEESAKVEKHQVTDMLQRLLDLGAVVRTAAGALRLTKRALQC